MSTCMNPLCRKTYTPGHYGKRQKVCCGSVVVSCSKCHGSGAKDGNKCFRCGGKKKVKQTCKEWYRIYWSQSRKPPRGVSKEHFDQIEKAARKDTFHHALLVIARWSALRKGELLGLTWSDVLDSSGSPRPTIPIRGQWSDGEGFKGTKTGSSDIAYFPKEACTEIAAFRKWAVANKLGCAPKDRVFEISEASVWKWFQAIQKKLEIVNPETGYPHRWHDLRHTRGVELGRAGRLDLVQKALRHRNINTSAAYAERPPEEFLEEMENVSKNSTGGEIDDLMKVRRYLDQKIQLLNRSGKSEQHRRFN